MNIENLIRDRYNREARLMPALLVALPALIAVFAWFPTLRSVGASLLIVLGGCGAMVWLAQLARDRGKELQPSLYASWGGQPSVAALRHRDGLLPVEQKARYRAFLSKAVPQLKLPSLEDETRDPEAADRAYEAACSWLLAQTRDKKRFGLLFEENVNYGFRRNFWAMKPMALAISGLSLAASLGALEWEWLAGGNPPGEAVAASVLIGLYLVFVATRVSRKWVRVPAIAYARQLLAACDVLSPHKDPSRRTAA